MEERLSIDEFFLARGKKFLSRRIPYNFNPQEMAKKEDRKKCYFSRDEFFACIDKFAETPEDQVSKCNELKSEFERSCPPSWVHHFVLQRVAPPPSEHT